jgi:LysM repeat protein
VLAWTILPITLVTAGMKGSIQPAQATMRTASSTEDILTSTLTITTPSVTASPPATRYVVQPGDTLSSIAARLDVRGGWPALYTLNLRAIGRDPNAIRAGTVLTVPRAAGPVRYTVAAGDTLSAIAAGLRVPGGWPALYAANRRAIGHDPDAIRPGTVLTIPRRAAAPPAPAQGQPRPPAPAAAPPTAAPSPDRPGTRAVPAARGMPAWLKTMLLAVGLLILAAFLTETVLVTWRRRQRARSETVPAAQSAEAGPGRWPRPASVQGQDPATVPGPPGAEAAGIVLADHDRLVVTCNERDDTVYVLRPPGEDPRAILRVARLVLPEGRYGELARQLGMPAIGPVE